MEQPFHRGNNMLVNSVETPTLAEYLLSRNDTNMGYLNTVAEETDGLSLWNLRGPNSSSYIANQENHDETKMDEVWNTTLSINSGVSASVEERHLERSSILPLDNVDLNLNNTPVDDGQTFTQSLSSSHESVTEEHNLHAGLHSNIMEVPLCPFMPGFFEPEHAPYSSSNGCSSNVVELAREDDGRTRSSIEYGLLACKRKNVDGVIGESSTSHSISANLSMPSSSRYLPGASSLDENLASSFSHVSRGGSSGLYPSSSVSGNAESSQRNIRMRPNHSPYPSHQHDVSPLQSYSAASGGRFSTLWFPGEPFGPNPFAHSGEQGQHHALPFPGTDDQIHHYPSNSRFVHRRLVASPEETSISSLPRNGTVDNQTFATRITADNMEQASPNWNPSSSRDSSSSNVVPLLGSGQPPSEVINSQHPTYLSEFVRGSESGHQGSNPSSRHSSRSITMVDPGQSSRAVRIGHAPVYSRTAVPLDRQRDGVSVLSRSREGRSRMISEIRNALDLMCRGGNLRLEDVFLFDRSLFFGRADLYDRYRDMRLDVDNMSYEELLALEERIGNVSTGLDEVTILRCLRQQKYSPCKLEVESADEEPCCICREDYSEGEDIGILNCKHDFHTACIKQWLMIKNLCPICKTTAVAT